MRKLHSEGKKVGLNVMGQGELIDMEEAGIIQPMLVNLSMIE